MTDNSPERRSTFTLPSDGGRIGQGTEVEKSRATSQVHYAVLVAQQVPRDIDAVYAEMRRECANPRLAQKAKYALPRGGKEQFGPSIHLARELIRMWRNCDYGVFELRQDDHFGQSEMLAVAWDMQTNTRSGQTFIVPHKRDAGKSVQKLTSMADIYLNNANMGARRLRQAIFSVLPDTFWEEAVEICDATLARGDGSELSGRIKLAVEGFSSKFGITEQMLATERGKPRARWTPQDVAELQVLYRSLDKGELTVAEAFPASRVTADEVKGGRNGPGKSGAWPKQSAPNTEPEPDPRDETAELPAPGTKEWHDAEHPREALDGSVETQAELLNGDCGFCEHGGGA